MKQPARFAAAHPMFLLGLTGVFMIGCGGTSDNVSPTPPTPVATEISAHSGDGQTSDVGTAVATPPSVRITDSNGDAVSGFPVTFSVTSGGGNITGATQTSSADGVATVGSWMLGPEPGPNTISATASGLSGSPVTFTATGTPVDTVAASTLNLALGGYHSCAISTQGTVCWGWNQTAQLGDGTTTDRSTPVFVGGGLKFTSLAAGTDDTCGLTAAGQAYCFGNNTNGQLGNSASATEETAPTAVAGSLSFASLSLGVGFSCGLQSIGAVYCWGSNYHGELGDGTEVNQAVPEHVFDGAKYISIGDYNGCALDAAGRAGCWGDNTYGQLGDGTVTSRATIVDVAGALTFSTIAAGGNSTCGITTNGLTYCWGSNISGQLGDGTNTNSSVPVAVNAPAPFTQLSVGTGFACGLTQSSAVYCWGAIASALVDGLPSNVPVAVPGGHAFAFIATGAGHACGGATDGGVWCWGENSYGQLGNGTTSALGIATPVRVGSP